MAHGKPDWGLVGPKQTIYGLDDVGEAAARLGSPVIWDRRGDVVLMDSFEHGTCQSATTVFGAGDNYHLLCGASRHGGHSLRYYLAGAAGSQGQTQWTICSTGQMVNGFELSFGWVDTIASVGLVLQYHDGVNVHEARATYWPVGGVLAYRDALNVDILIQGGLGLTPLADPIHVFKIVADFDVNEYVRVILDENTWTLPGIALRDFGGATGPYVNAYVTVVQTLAATGAFIMDRTIVTQNEPI